MNVILAGASGLVGGIALREMSDRPGIGSITTVTRRPVPSAGHKHVPIVAPIDEWPAQVAKSAPDVGICCLGTTIKAAGSKDAFAEVDLSAVAAFAKSCRDAGARQFVMVTSVGADPNARNFYLAIKGRAEIAVRDLEFERLDIMRPGLLLGHRDGPVRVGERIAMALSPLTDLLTPQVLSRYRSIPAKIVGRAIADCVGATEPGVFKHHNDDMRAIRSELD